MNQSRSFITLIVLTGISLAGFSFVWPLTTLYVTHVLGLPITVGGAVLALEAASGMAGSFVGGILFDRMSGKWLMGCCSILVAAASFSLVVWHAWMMFLFSYAVINVSMGALVTAINSAVGQVYEGADRKGYNVIYISRNVGVSVGVALGGLVASASFMYAFLLNGLCFSLIPLIVWIGLRHTPLQVKDSPQRMTTSLRVIRSRQSMLLILGLGSLFTMVSYMQWQSTLSVYMQDLGKPLGLYSLLWTLNGILALVLQPLSSYVTRYIPSERLQLLAGEFVFVLSFVVLIVTPSTMGFITAMILATVAEVMVWPMIPAITASIAPNGKSGFYQGMMNMFSSAGRLFGPITGSLLYQWKGAAFMLWIMALVYLVALLCFACCKSRQVLNDNASSTIESHQLV